VSDGREEQLGPRRIDRSHRRLKSAWPILARVQERCIDVPVEALRAIQHFLRDRIVDPFVPSAEIDLIVSNRTSSVAE
jgi:hypothetical protein